MSSSPSMPRVTMDDVARRAGVSKASVSRFIGEGRGLLSEAIAERIEHAIDTLGYRPNQMARALKRGRTRLVGMLVADIRNPYSIAVMHGVETACRQHGYTLVVCNTDRDPEQERQQLAALRSYRVEGLIVNTLGQHVEQLRQLQLEVPIVLVDRKVEGLGTDLVGLANAEAVAVALDHLVERGYREVLLVSEPILGTSSRRERAVAFEQWLAAHGHVRGQVMETGDSLGARLAAWHAQAQGPAAVFCANGLAALATTLALRERGLKLFEQIGLLALDDLEWYPLVGDGITALAQPTQAIGEHAFTCLLQRLQGEQCPPRSVSLAAQLIVRGSTPDRT